MGEIASARTAERSFGIAEEAKAPPVTPDGRSFEDVAEEAADCLDGVITVLQDIRDPYAGDPRIHAAIAALKHMRGVFGSVLEYCG